MVELVWPQEVIISDPEGQVIVRTFYTIETVCMSVRCPVGAVETLDQLFVGTELSGDSIIVCKADHLRDLKL